MANNKNFRIRNNLSAKRYVLNNGTFASSSTSYDFDNIIYGGNSFSVASQTSQASDLTFSPDGTNMYIADDANKAIDQYTLSTPFDISTAAYASKTLSVSSFLISKSLQALDFSSDGTKLFFVNFDNDVGDDSLNRVFQWSLSTAWDVSTATYDSIAYVTGNDGGANPTGLKFKSDGTSFYATYLGNVYQWDLSTAYDLSSTVTYQGNLTITEDNRLNGIDFSSDGTAFFLAGNSTDSVIKYTLSTPWDISTGTYDSSFSIAAQGAAPAGVRFSTDGSKMFLLEGTNEDVFEYLPSLNTRTFDLSSGNLFSMTINETVVVSFTNPPPAGKVASFSIKVVTNGNPVVWPSSVKWPGGTTPTTLDATELYVFITTDGGNTYYGKKAYQSIVEELT